MLLTDVEIEKANFIIRDYDAASLRGCTYEFRVSDIAYRYDYDARVSRQERSDNHVIRPLETVTIITKETVCLDRLHFLSLFSKGFLFSLGIVPVSTGADPGFEGRLGITLTNMSARPVKLPVDTRFVKGIFHQLLHETARPYAGQHGDASVSWPYPAQFHEENFSQREYIADMNRFLPRSIADAVAASLRFSRMLTGLIWLFGALVVIDVASYLASHVNSSAPWASRTVETLNVVGALASMLGLVIVAIQEVRIAGLRKVNE